MRNLKRALSLALSTVMLMGMMVVGSGAAGYTDVTSEHNQEAIEVMQAVGIMTGDDQGDFNPDQNVTRGEMAVIMANLLDLGIANYVGAPIPFTDVPDWAHAYVAACYANGITGGTSDTTYGTDDPITAVQAGLMMLKALGYFQYQGDFDNNGGWILGTVSQAARIDLYDGIDAETEQPLTRNDIAQLALNTLEADMVEFTGDRGMDVTSSDGTTVTVGFVSRYDERTSTNSRYGAIDDETEDSNVSRYTMQLGEDLYDGDLKLDETADDFGRPARVWTYGSTEVGTYADSGDLKATFTAEVDRRDIYNTLGSAVRDDLRAGESSLTVYVDGWAYPIARADVDSYMDRNNTSDIMANLGLDGDNGTLTEVYVNDDHDVDIVVVNTYVFQASSNYSESNESIRVSIAGDTAISLTNSTLEQEDFSLDLSTVEEDDYLLINAVRTGTNRYEAKVVALAEIVTGEVTAYSDGDNVTLDDGETYEYSATAQTSVCDEIQATGGETALVLDAYGYVIAVDDTVVSGNYVYITDTRVELGNTVNAYGYFGDGTEGTLALRQVNGNSNADTMDDADGWYSYSVNSSNQYTLNSVGGSYDTWNDTHNDPAGAPAASATPLLVNGQATLPVQAGSETIRANDRTIFVIVDEDGDVAVYTGVTNAPDITVNAGNTGSYDIGYIWRDSTNYATYVFVDVQDCSDVTVDASSEDDVYYFFLRQSATLNDGDETYYEYKILVDGAEQTMYGDTNMNSDVANTNTGWMQLYNKIKVDNSSDRITGMTYVTNDNAGDETVIDITNATVNYRDGVLTIEGSGFSYDFLVNSDSQLNYILDYNRSNKGSSDQDVRDLMEDGSQRHESHTGVTGSDMNSRFNGYTISGTIYAVTADDSSVVDAATDTLSGNTTIRYLYLYVNGATNTGATTAVTPTLTTSGRTDYTSASDTPEALTVSVTNAASCGTLTYQWQLNGTDISGATSSSYTPASLTDGDVYTCVVTNTDSDYDNPASATATFDAISVQPIEAAEGIDTDAINGTTFLFANHTISANAVTLNVVDGISIANQIDSLIQSKGYTRTGNISQTDTDEYSVPVIQDSITSTITVTVVTWYPVTLDGTLVGYTKSGSEVADIQMPDKGADDQGTGVLLSGITQPTYVDYSGTYTLTGADNAVALTTEAGYVEVNPGSNSGLAKFTVTYQVNSESAVGSAPTYAKVGDTISVIATVSSEFDVSAGFGGSGNAATLTAGSGNTIVVAGDTNSAVDTNEDGTVTFKTTASTMLAENATFTVTVEVGESELTLPSLTYTAATNV